MENLMFNLNSVEISYGDNALTSIIQIEERIRDIAESLNANDEFSTYEKQEVRDRLNKLIAVNNEIQKALERQANDLTGIQARLMKTKMVI